MSSALQSKGGELDYYAPRFEVEVEGQKLPAEKVADVLSCKVVMDLNNLTSFDLTVNNQATSAPGLDGKPGSLRFQYVDDRLFYVGNRVKIKMGYDKLLPMVTGLITSMTPSFPESGPPSLSIAGQDEMILLKNSKPGKKDKKRWEEVYDYQVAQDIAKRHKLDTDISTDTSGLPKHDEVVQKNQDDATFLMERAKRIDFECAIVTDPTGSARPKLIFKPAGDRRSGSADRYVFTWGRNLINFAPRLTIANMVSKVTVRGWDPDEMKPIEYTATPSDLGIQRGDTGPSLVAKALGAKQEQVVDSPVTSLAEAQKLAKALLQENADRFVTGNARCIGLPDLRPGHLVELRELGERFSGDYLITKVEHSISSSGYFTQFAVRRHNVPEPKGGS